jgi:glutamate carboxypeptidase
LRALGRRRGAEFLSRQDADVYRMGDTPKQVGRMGQARFSGTGSKKVPADRPMDTVYLRGMLAKQPFRVEGSTRLRARHRRRQAGRW